MIQSVYYPIPKPGVVWRIVDGEAVLVLPAKGEVKVLMKLEPGYGLLPMVHIQFMIFRSRSVPNMPWIKVRQKLIRLILSTSWQTKVF